MQDVTDAENAGFHITRMLISLLSVHYANNYCFNAVFTMFVVCDAVFVVVSTRGFQVSFTTIAITAF